ncbi:MAG: ThuA domain-containing protein [bacterium]|nr:ThuA domain-containing protein [bacterium]MCP5065831.1 ThuA domain-containing protein [bacterium]
MHRIVFLLAVLAPLALPGCNAIRTFFPSHAYESEPPELPADLGAPAILVFTKTNGFRHQEAIPAGLELLESIAQERGWSIFHTENGAAFTPEILSRFAATVWHNSSGDTLSPDQREAFKSWLLAGGGFVGLHGAGGDPAYDWAWYVEELIGAQFIGHPMGPQFQEGTLVVEDRTHAATRELPASFAHVEEWYSFDRSPRAHGFRVLARVEESSYSPELHMLWMDEDLRMGDDHPIVWSRCLEKGRTLFSALGHQGAAYQRKEMRSLLSGAIAWAAGLEGPGC